MIRVHGTVLNQNRYAYVLSSCIPLLIPKSPREKESPRLGAVAELVI